SAAGAAGAEASANVALSTNYMFRGISQTGGDAVEPAISGGFDFSHERGLYLGTWASNVELSDADGDGEIADMELDIYGGFSGEMGGLGYDVGLLYYWYPGTDKLDFFEYYAGINSSLGSADVGLSINISPDFYAESGNAYYLNASASLPLSDTFGFNASVGYQSIDEENIFGTPDYHDWKIGVTTAGFGLDLELAWIDTDLSSSECFGTDFCAGRAVFTASKSF
ncbi:MAG TPA: TorF family putative porin, partial [Thiohalobacter sp.]|nr:TorF family putative porin [Thiohalobacter sp.]